MPSLTEEDPDYPEKVKAYLTKWHLRRLPWGFIVAHGHLVSVATTEERRTREYLGETAIKILRTLGVTESNLAGIDIMADAGLNDQELVGCLPFSVTPMEPVRLVPPVEISLPAVEPPAPDDPVPGT